MKVFRLGLWSVLGVWLAGCGHWPVPAVMTGSAQIAEYQPFRPDGVIRAQPMPSAKLSYSKAPQRIIFASCAQQNEDQSIWNQIADEQGDLLLFIGDNVYGDVHSKDPAMPELKAAYMRLAQSKPFAQVRRSMPLLAVWDDHDYGMNDAGGDYPYKENAQALFNFVWAVPKSDPRRQRPGIYRSWLLGEAGQRVQVILLDTRFFRSPLKPTDAKGALGKERYIPDPDPSKTMLGEVQWAWLYEELQKPADLRLLVSSIQVIAEGHGWEAWRTLPLQREKLFETIEKAGARNLIILSGDRHAAGLYRRDDALSYPLVEATSSSLNLPASKWRAESGERRMEAGPHRLGDMVYEANYGVLDIDWEARKLQIAIRGAQGENYLRHTVQLDALQ